jgi:hypothetical protein
VSLDPEADRLLTALHRIENDVRRIRDEPRISRSGLACRAIRVYALTLAMLAKRKERKDKEKGGDSVKIELLVDGKVIAKTLASDAAIFEMGFETCAAAAAAGWEEETMAAMADINRAGIERINQIEN